MAKSKLSKRLLVLVLSLVMLLSLASPVSAVNAGGSSSVAFEKVDNSLISADLSARKVSQEAENIYQPNDVVRVSIVLDELSTIEAGFAAEGIAENAAAMSYRDGLKAEQDAVETRISAKALAGEELNVVWNLTLAANLISANVPYSAIESIKTVSGVKEVIIENQYAPDVVGVDTLDPDMSTSSAMVGSNVAYSAGYYGEGSKIAVIDTGTDTDHKSFDAAAFEYAVGDDAALMTADDIAAVLEQLNIYSPGMTAESLYLNAKLPFAYNYVDGDFDITHDNDTQGEHGSHVAGIATANRYINNGDGTFAEALTEVHTQGVAPDAQLITMKVFGKGGGAYDSDYMAAIEDAIVLGADSINLSLGSGNPGFSGYGSEEYQKILDNMAKSGAVVCMSAGNSGTWQENTLYGYLYSDGVSMQTNGSPGSYTNSLSVASVDNTGNTGNFLDFGAGLSAVSFTETSGYSNPPIAGMDKSEDGSGTEYDFVIFDNTGADGSGNNLLTDYADICAGKIVMVYRGTSSFYEKLDAVGEVGGAACIVINNQAGTINMDLSGATAAIPCVSIQQADGAAIKALSTTTAVTGDGDAVLYYTGKVTVSSAIKSVQGDVDGYWTMSSFSSWGIPGSLEMKPEITAPGGNIYSVNGAVAGGQAYENMSGTSMASPQMAGMVAVAAEYIRENGLTEKTGLTARQLAQSLLMSTAKPIKEEDSENWYSVLTQGAGVANVGAAVSANSYIVMDESANAGAADGKVKVELGDDPAKTGVYTFSYDIMNLTDEERFYEFSTDVFTQDLFMAQTYTGYDILLDTWTIPLEATVSYEVTGGSSVLNGDKTQYAALDAQKVLDALANDDLSLLDADKNYDVDGDGEVTTYDAHLILNMSDMKGEQGAVLPANGKLTVTVTIDVTGCDFSDYPTGAYIEAYTYAKEFSTAEGVEGTVHSIPVLGYYGNWTSSSMYDVGTLADYWYETEARYPYLVNETQCFTNYLTVKYPGDVSEYYFFGNPLTDDDEYLTERNAFNSNGVLNKYYVSIIRNAGNAMWQVTDATTGELYYRSADLGRVNSAYYYSNGSAWRNTQSSVSLGWQGTDMSGEKLAEGTEVNVSLVLAPEYYASEDGSYNWTALTDGDLANGELGKGAYMTTRTAIDNTAPEMTELTYNVETRELTATAADNRYLAVVALYQNGVEKERGFVAPNQALDAKGAAADYTLEVPANATSNEFYIQLTDYAMNQSTYKFVITENGVDDEKVTPTSITLPATAVVVKGTSIKLTPEFEPWLAKTEVTWSSADESIATVDADGFVTGVAVGEVAITATSIYDATVSASCPVTVKAYEVTLNGMLQDTDGNPMLFSWDLANDKTWKNTVDIENYINAATFDFAHEDGAIFQMDTSGYLYKVEPTTGETLDQSAATIAFGAPVDDMEYAGLSSLKLEQDVLVGVYGSYFLYSNPGMDNTFSSGWNLSSYLNTYLDASNFTAIAWAGYDNQGRDVFFCLTDTGDFWVMMPDFTTGSASLNFYNTDLELDFPGYDGAYYCSMVLGDDGNFYLSYFNGSTNQIYVLEGENIYEDGNYSDTVYHATLLGDVGDGVWPCALLSVSENEKEAAADSSALPAYTGRTESVAELQAQQIEFTGKEAAAEPAAEETVALQSINAMQVSRPAANDVDGTVIRETGRVYIELDAEASTNGLVEVAYDADVLTLLTAGSDLELHSINTGKDGLVKVAYAVADAVTGNAAELVFSYDKDNCPNTTTVTLTTLEDGASFGESAENLVVTLKESPVIVVTPTTPTTPSEPEPPTTEPDEPGTSCDGGANCPSAKFTDVNTALWYHEGIDYVVSNGLMSGVSATSFAPNAETSRAMIVTVLYRLAGSPAVTAENPFTDLTEDWYRDAVIWGYANGIVNGVSTDKFDPNASVTREQLASFLYRYAQYTGKDVSAKTDITAFADAGNVSTWALDAVKWAVAEGLIQGTGAGLEPKGVATRAQFATILMRYGK